MRDVVKEKTGRLICNSNLSRSEKCSRTKYYNCLNQIAHIILKSENSDLLKDCAYININKRGGYNTCNINQLKNYAKEYENEILKQLEIINPENVVLLGFGINIMPDSIKNRLEQINLYEYRRHPSRYRNIINNENDLIWRNNNVK